ncbi:DNA-binding response regulator, NarL/FixJ family, contains REC and HTH domains [Faunimonas pinastri]|uniref:DNA-binding response regulator, NarL/FixJ family, contains REC and HTH domains n=1 Tax=Faunimonas pinastri TaxID=1855383 RepID=A0A1H8Z1F2_9HYPH|nr:response regulator transcription factor [Faunimonas pinastri]SEP58186.1 DNA-binding response regulator, NarL/FixJ family, contains REC and HTH domains [Faunimonas pinastri]
MQSKILPSNGDGTYTSIPVYDVPPQVLAGDREDKTDYGRRSTDLPIPTGPMVQSIHIVLIHPRMLIRECLVRTLNSFGRYFQVSAFASLEEWEGSGVAESPDLVLFVIDDGDHADSGSKFLAARLSKLAGGKPFIILSDTDGADEVISALQSGARGYLPTSIPLEIAIEAIRLVNAGGIFIPAESLMQSRESGRHSGRALAADHAGSLLTERQRAVLAAIRKGQANKVIARELNMCESTVKVHVRNIMKKLNAKNRTHAALLAHDLLLDN